MRINRLEDMELAGKRLLIREDLNVPLKDGLITNDARIRAALPTLRLAVEQGAKTIVLSHLGRPVEGLPLSRQPAVSLAPVAARLSELLDLEVPLLANWPDQSSDAPVALAENVRLLSGEQQNEDALAKQMVARCDLFVMDAFATAHRTQASTHGAICFAPVSCAGPLLVAELEAMHQALEAPARPFLALVGGSKISDKLPVLESLARKVDQLVVGGGIANTFIAAAGYPVGKSMYEAGLLDIARRLQETTQVHLPVDLVVASEISDRAEISIRSLDEVQEDEMILDVGPASTARLHQIISEAGTLLWNGPLGVFEVESFSAGTRQLAEAVAASRAFSLAGGGDTLAAIERFGVAEGMSHISTGGGAFLEAVAGLELPALVALNRRYQAA